MNAIGATFVWAAVQITLFMAVGSLAYLIARRRGPAWGSLAAASTLGAVLVVSLLAISPWPRWWNVGAKSAIAGVAASASSVSSVERESHNDLAIARSNSQVGDTEDATAIKARLEREIAASQGQAALFSIWADLVDGLRTEPVAVSTAWRWPAWIAIGFFVVAAFSALRIVLGLSAVARYRRRSTPVTDPEMLVLVQDIRGQLSCAQPVDVRESSEIASPATVGWRQPVILLPIEWRQWTPDELRVVIAHEVAHIARGDYAAWIVAQFGLALHFYHPLVHWLAARLRVEQELAADSLGASAAGGRTHYLETLARMALRADDSPALAWAARPFFPGSGAFLRRINMLRQVKELNGASPNRGVVAALLGGLAVFGVLIAGVRGPESLSVARAADEPTLSANADATGSVRDLLRYVPEDSTVVAIIRPADIASQMSPDEVASLLQHSEVRGLLRIDPKLIEQVVIVGNPGPQPQEFMIFRVSPQFDQSRILPALQLNGSQKKVSPNGQKYFFKPPFGGEILTSLHEIDERTFLIGRESCILQVLETKASERKAPSWAATLVGMSKSQVAVTVNVASLRALAPLKESANASFAMISPFLDEADRAFLTGAWDGAKFDVKISADATSNAGAEKIGSTGKAMIVFLKNYTKSFRQQIAQTTPPLSEQYRLLADAWEPLLESAGFSQTGQRVEVSATTQFNLNVASATFFTAIADARNTARRSQSQNNVKQIMLAMNNYAVIHGHFPPASILGPDGKTPHSWRVALLPIFEEKALYDQYKLDEPWNSENNLKVLAQMPRYYRSPTAEGNPNHYASYFVMTGERAPFAADARKKGLPFKEITDGASNTIAVFEAKLDIPWTKPDDIPYEPGKPLPKLGGFYEGGFVSGFFDGFVRFLPETIDAETLERLIQHNEGKPVDRNKL